MKPVALVFIGLVVVVGLLLAVLRSGREEGPPVGLVPEPVASSIAPAEELREPRDARGTRETREPADVRSTRSRIPVSIEQPQDSAESSATSPRAGTLSGIVTCSDLYTPAAGARVHLVELERVVVADVEGSFLFEKLPRGDYTIYATGGPCQASRFMKLSLPKRGLSDVWLCLRAVAGLEVSLIAPPGGSCDGLLLHVKYSRNASPLARGPSIRGRADCAFTHENLREGKISLYLGGRDSRDDSLRLGEAHGPWSSYGVSLGEAYLEKGRVLSLEYDLRDRWPGTLVVRSRVEGRTGEDLVVQVQKVDKHYRTPSLLELSRDFAVGPDGVARAGYLLPGDYRLQVASRTSGWTYADKITYAVHPGSEVAVELRIVPVRGTLLIRAAEDGRILSHCKIDLYSGQSHGSLKLTTSADGRLELDLLPGVYHLWSRRGLESEMGAKVELRWTSDGPTTSEIRMPL